MLLGVVLPLVHDFALLVEEQDVITGPFLQCVKVRLDGSKTPIVPVNLSLLPLILCHLQTF